MRARFHDRQFTPPAQVGVAVAILLLLGLAVVVLRAGADDDASALGDTALDDPAQGDEAQDDGAPGDNAPPAEAGDESPRSLPPPGRDTGTPPAEGEPVEADQPAVAQAPSADDVVLPPGTCIDDDGRADDVAGVEVVDCAVPHTSEVFAATLVTQPQGAPYPGMAVLRGDTREFCQGPVFEDYVGTSFADSRFFVYWLVPTEESWAAGDRDVACVFYDTRGLMTGSQRGTRQ